MCSNSAGGRLKRVKGNGFAGRRVKEVVEMEEREAVSV
jgi:hypothetical protein